MRLWNRFSSSGLRRASAEDHDHLSRWARSRRGVEAYVEPETKFLTTTVVLVAADGEWTRRRVAGPRAAAALGKELGIPVYDVFRVGYPRRMREYNRRISS